MYCTCLVFKQVTTCLVCFSSLLVAPSLCHSITSSLCHSVTPSLHHFITVTLSLHHSVTVTPLLCHSVTVGKQCWITALHVSRQNVCVGLTNGKILILRSVGGTLSPLTTFSCHQQQVKCLTTLPPDHSHRKGHRDNRSWQRSTTSPRPAHLLVSCGLGFHSYPTPSPSDGSCIPHPNELPPGKLLTWDMSGLQ